MQLIPTPQAFHDALSLLQLLLLAVYLPVLAYAFILALGWIPILMSLFEGVSLWGPGRMAGRVEDEAKRKQEFVSREVVGAA